MGVSRTNSLEFNASLWCVNRHSNSSMQTVDAT